MAMHILLGYRTPSMGSLATAPISAYVVSLRALEITGESTPVLGKPYGETCLHSGVLATSAWAVRCMVLCKWYLIRAHTPTA